MAASLSLAFFGLTACGGFDSRVPIVGPPSDVAQLVGHWDGQFRSAATHRMGILELELEAQQDTAQGAVYLIPDYSRMSDDPSRGSIDPGPTVLRIESIEIEGTRVRGILESYRDPFTDQMVRTTFMGRLSGDDLSGSYVIRYETGDEATGQWSATRVTGS